MELNRGQPVVMPEKIILQTYEKASENQHFYDCRFNLTTNNLPGKGGTYKVIINESFFQRTHPLLDSDDYIIFRFPNSNTDPIRLTVDAEVYFSAVDQFVSIFQQVLVAQKISEITLTPLTDPTRSPGGEGLIITSTAGPFTMECSMRFGYIFNNLNKILSSSDPQPNVFNLTVPANSIVFMALDVNGPINYVIETNLIPRVPTTGEDGRMHNMTGITYNTTFAPNNIVQFYSTMELITNNLSEFRIQLFDDAGKFVKIHTPMYLQLTVMPYMDPNDNRSYYRD